MAGQAAYLVECTLLRNILDYDIFHPLLVVPWNDAY